MLEQHNPSILELAGPL